MTSAPRAGPASPLAQCSVAAPRFTALLTRPAGQSAMLAARLGRAGIASVELPLLTIEAAVDPAPLDAVFDALDQYALLVFVSPNAVLQAVMRWRARGDWPLDFARRAPALAVVGPGSLLALRAAGLGRCLTVAPAGAAVLADTLANEQAAARADAAPRARAAADVADGGQVRFDSEALLTALANHWSEGLAALRQRRVALIRGDGGRELLGDSLRDAGAQVDAIVAYRRAGPRWQDPQWQIVQAGLGDPGRAWLVSSSEAVRHFADVARARLDAAQWSRLRHETLIAPHARIADAARRCGFDTIRLSGPGDAAIAGAFLAAAAEQTRRV